MDSGVSARTWLGLLRGFDTRTIYYDSMEVPGDVQKELKAEPASFEVVLSQSDFVTLHVGLTSRTRKLIGERELGMMMLTAYLINTWRGEVVDEPALLRALQDKAIAGAALDVTDPEHPFPATTPCSTWTTWSLRPIRGPPARARSGNGSSS